MGTEMSAIVECRNFSFFYGKSRILERINFSLQKGEWLSIVGPNGSGKSTLLKNMLRLAYGRAEGEILIEGKSIGRYDQKELAKILAYMPQTYQMPPPFTVREFVHFSRYPYGMREKHAEAKEMDRIQHSLILTRMDSLAERPMNKLSGGQLQRAFLAAALAQATPVLLLDEPASFLDPAIACEIIELLKKLHTENGLTILVVSHDLNLPFDVGSKILVLNESEQLYFGSVNHLESGKILDEAFKHSFNYLVHPKTGKTLVIA